MKTAKKLATPRQKFSKAAPTIKRAPEPDIESVIGRLKTLRLQNNWGQDDIADFLGISRTAYASIESKDSMKGISKIIKLKNLYKTTYSYILEGIVGESLASQAEIQKRDVEIQALKNELGLLKETLDLYKELRKRK